MRYLKSRGNFVQYFIFVLRKNIIHTTNTRLISPGPISQAISKQSNRMNQNSLIKNSESSGVIPVSKDAKFCILARRKRRTRVRKKTKKAVLRCNRLKIDGGRLRGVPPRYLSSGIVNAPRGMLRQRRSSIALACGSRTTRARARAGVRRSKKPESREKVQPLPKVCLRLEILTARRSAGSADRKKRADYAGPEACTGFTRARGVIRRKADRVGAVS